MKVTIEIDPATLTTVVTSAVPTEASVVPLSVADAAAQSGALDAGACSGLPGVRTTFVPRPTATASDAASAGVAPPPHRDTFGLRNGDNPSDSGISAGSPLGGAGM